MTSLEAYQSLLLKVNRNDSNSNIQIPRGKFVVLYNEQAPKWLAEKLSKKLSSDELDNLSDLLEDEVPLTKLDTHRNFSYFAIPDGFYKISSSYSLASKDGCIDRILTNWNTKAVDIRDILNDENNNPSFEFEETPITVVKNKLKVYFADFSIDDVFLSYYREPSKIDLLGYIKVDGSQSQDIHPDISDIAVNEIITRCAAEVMRNNQNAEGLQFQKDRIQFE